MTGPERAFAKLNLCLDVTEKLPDGYHAVRGIMQSIDFGDDVWLEAGGESWQVQSGLRYLPTGESNLAARAALLYRSLQGEEPGGGTILLKKRIPVCGGFGGGSSDAAAVLRLLDRDHPRPLGLDRLEKESLSLGADVPFCIRGGTALAEGKGEVLTPLPPCVGWEAVICRPDFLCSTPELFRAVDKLKMRIRPDVAGMEKAVREGDLQGVARRLFNVFEEVLSRKNSDTVWEIKDLLLDAGALGAVMTGTGSGVFGLFPDARSADEACHRLREEGYTCYRAKTTGPLL